MESLDFKQINAFLHNERKIVKKCVFLTFLALKGSSQRTKASKQKTNIPSNSPGKIDAI